MHQQFIVQPGQDLDAASLPAGETRGIAVDNPSGSWLQVFPTYDLIPPYTIGWATTPANALASVTIRSVPGPAGQESTTTGDPYTVTLSSGPLQASAGAPAPGSSFVTNLQNPPLFSDQWAIAGTAFIPPLDHVTALLASTTQRIRLFQIGLVDPMNSFGPGLRMTEFLTAMFSISGTGTILGVCHIDMNKQTDVISLPPYTLPRGFEIMVQHFVSGTDPISVEGFLTYGIV